MHGMRSLLIKISADLQKNKLEYEILKKLNYSKNREKTSTYHFPLLFGGGEFVVSHDSQSSQFDKSNQKPNQFTRHSFIVMEPLG